MIRTMDADRIIARLGLKPHPEGGWYRQTRTAEGPGRALATCIRFLLKAGERSHWHKVDADEIRLWHGGGPLPLSISATSAGPGPRSSAARRSGHRQAARPTEGRARVGCVVAPGFRFQGFTLAGPGFDIPRGG
jgi:predicted cupin superfamily sugar epimerase